MTQEDGRDAASTATPSAAGSSTTDPAPLPEDAADASVASITCATRSTAVGAANAPDDEEPEVTTAEFELELADGQTWAMNFYECAAEGDLECLEEILDSRKVGVNDTDVDGFTALMVAAAEGHRAVVRALLTRGADVGGRTHELRSTALHFAAKNGDAEIVEALCTHDGAVVDCWNINADTPLIWACIEGRADAVRVLLAHGADVSVLNQYGASTLLCAVMIGEDPEQDTASDTRRAEILRLLLEKKASLVNFQDREGSTAMHLAASCGYLACVKTLLSFGADITLRNTIGQTPLEEAQTSDLRESGACVEHLRGIWRQLEEEAAARMMAMLEMEEAGSKSCGKSAPSSGAGGKKGKKKNKKAKRKAAKQQQAQKMEAEPATTASGARSETVAAAEEAQTAKDDDVESTGSASSSDDDEDARARASTSSKHSNEGNEGAAVVEEAAAAGADQVTEGEDLTPAAAEAWTTVGKKHRSALAAISKPPVDTSVTASSSSPLKEVSPKRPAPRPALRRPPTTATSPAKLAIEPKIQRPEAPATTSARERNGDNVRSLLLSSRLSQSGASTSYAAAARGNLQPAKPQEERWDDTSGFVATAHTSRSLLSSSLLNPSAASFRSPPSLVASTPAYTSMVSSFTGSSPSSLDSRGLSLSPTASPWRPSFSSTLSTAPSTSTASSHYSAVGRLTWKQQRAGGGNQLVREARERWVSKLRLSNESVAEALSSLACGLCGELVSDNLQCSGGSAATACTQLYCASCLQSTAFHTAESRAFRCVKCHEVVDKARMAPNSLAQAQAAALGLSTSAASSSCAVNASAASNTPDEAARATLDEMQHTLETAEPRAAAVDLHAFHLTPGAELGALSNGQLEVLERAHQLALHQIVERRLANARALERLQMEEWLKMQRDVLLFAPR